MKQVQGLSRRVILLTHSEDPILPQMRGALSEQFLCTIAIPLTRGRHLRFLSLSSHANNCNISFFLVSGSVGGVLGSVLHYLEFGLRVTIYFLVRRAEYAGAVVYAVDLPAAPLAWLIARGLHGRFILDYRELYCETDYVTCKRAWEFVERVLAPKADGLVTRNRPRADYLKSKLGLDREFFILPNIPEMCSKVPESREIVERVRSFSRGRRVVIYQGNLTKSRGVLNLVRSWSLNVGDRVLVLAGSADKRNEEEIHEAIRSMGLGSKVLYLGCLDRSTLLDITSACDVGVVIYRNSCLNNYYCAPTKLYEYLACGLPVVAPDFPGVRDLVSEANIGRLFDPEDPASIDAAIRGVLDDIQQYRANVSSVAPRLRWDSVKCSYVAFVRGVLHG